MKWWQGKRVPRWNPRMSLGYVLEELQLLPSWPSQPLYSCQRRWITQQTPKATRKLSELYHLHFHSAENPEKKILRYSWSFIPQNQNPTENLTMDHGNSNGCLNHSMNLIKILEGNEGRAVYYGVFINRSLSQSLSAQTGAPPHSRHYPLPISQVFWFGL